MIYSIGFKDKDGYMFEYDGQQFMWFNGEDGVLLKELCGEFPSMWDGKTVGQMLPVFENALNNLLENKEKYYYFYDDRYSTPEGLEEILNGLIERCKAFPEAVLEADQ